MRIRLLGTGTPTPSMHRMCTGYLVEIGKDVIAVDHGFGAHHRLLQLGIPATSVTHLFLTHLHYDHFGDYPRMVLTRWDQGAGKIPELVVFGPSPLKRLSDSLLGEQGAFGPDIIARTQHGCSLGIYQARGGTMPRLPPKPVITEVHAGDVVKQGGWTVDIAPTKHFQPYLETLAYRFSTPAGTLVCSGDSGPSAEMRALAERCDVLIHMCHYLSGTQLNDEFAESCMGHMELAKMAQDVQVKNLVLSHMTEQFDKPGMRERVIAEMSMVYKGNLFFGEDLMEVPVGAPSAAKLL